MLSGLDAGGKYRHRPFLKTTSSVHGIPKWTFQQQKTIKIAFDLSL